MSKPHQDRQERWQDLIWASHIYWCLSRRRAHSGTRCGRAGGSASGSLGKSRLQGCPSRGSKNIPIMWHRTKGMGKLLFNNVVQQNDRRLVLTARINRLSVAAGNISFSRVIFLQWAHWHRFYDKRIVCLWETEVRDDIHTVPMKLQWISSPLITFNIWNLINIFWLSWQGFMTSHPYWNATWRAKQCQWRERNFFGHVGSNGAFCYQVIPRLVHITTITPSSHC